MSSRSARGVFLATWLGIAAVLAGFRAVLLPFAFALLLAYLLQPLLERVIHLRKPQPLPRWIGVLSLYGAIFLVLGLGGVTVVPQLYQELSRVVGEGRKVVEQATPERIRATAEEVDAWMKARGIPVFVSTPSEGDEEGPGLRFDLERALGQVGSRLSHLAGDHLGDVVGVGQKVVGNVLGGVFRLFFLLMVTAFLLIDWNHLGEALRDLFPPSWASEVETVLGEVDRKLSGVVRGQVVICVVNGLLTFVGLVLLRIKFAVLLSVIATVLSFIPIFGTILSSVPIVAIGLTQGFQTGFAALGWIAGIHALEAYFLNPKIMGSAAKIHPVVIAFVLIAGEHTFGFVGALFAVPTTAIVLATVEFLLERAREALRPPPESEPTPPPAAPPAPNPPAPAAATPAPAPAA